ncbi:PREDICTED: ethylene-insensitive protein 2-like [Populus euphratica]|uniref:Ethylene-insensitive protein 2-like n=1 Tax=Populus euphratica TaxID=75702 RepID=A0AAJ6TGQ0_POPEU|nr:PREDICTED: ethylene-insensitive protein 2-like [Populus euphratica]XP_011010450.1 PREDICTED: ethylene-insensitive protein 2-like [Populus euphratica]XP_011010451.1 PREDICTED: ethylene-insensitive protein 2-like [Populus euphratica]XP_011010452.1 PREDICTED: ethylene-insensitive protein 2-like [Populus euphratica]
MDTEFANANHPLHFLHRLLPAVGPGLLIAIGYVDPGKWAATVEGGARFGFDLVLPMLLFNFVAILCQYLAARIGVITRKDLAQICNDEYDKWTCMFLGVQAALSVIALDLTMILGIAHGLNLLFGMDLSTCVFLAAADAILFPVFATLMERCKASFLCTCIAGFILLLYFFGVLLSQPEIPLSINGTRTKFSEESVFALMSLLGASIMPHNFFLHSSIVLQHQGPPNISRDALCLNHFFAILCIFSGIYLVNYVLMNSAANVFYSSGLVLLTFPDAMSLMEQVFRSPVAPFGFSLILFFANQITAFSWNLGGQVVLHNFLRLNIPNWLQRATFRIIAVVPALYCVWTSGVEGIYQLLILTQVMVALLLPSSVIPLFRVASSRQVMGVYKISPFLEFAALISFMGMLAIKITFVVEMIFGDSDWVGNLRWSTVSGSSTSYIFLLITACSSFCLMLWLAATPLKSATRSDAQVCNRDVQNAVSEPSTLIEEEFLTENRCTGEELIERQEQLPEPGKSFESYSDITVANADPDLPETIMESDQELHLTTIKEKHSEVTFSSPQTFYEETSPATESASPSAAVNLVPDAELLVAKKANIESMDPVEKTLDIEGELHTEKEDDEGDNWEPEDSSKGVPGSTLSLTSDGPGSFRSLSGKSDAGGNGAGSLSRLAGLGRAARRQLAAVLDEFWGQVYDFHGQITQEAKTKKLDALGVDLKLSSSQLKVDTAGKESSGYFSSVGGRASDSLINSSLCDSPKQLRLQSNIDSSYGVQRGPSSLWSNHMQLLDAYVQGPSQSIADLSERRYSGVRTPPSSDGWDNQPATVHGYQIASIVNRIAKDRGFSSLNGQMESPAPISPSLGPRNYRDPLTVSMGKKMQNGLSSSQALGFQNLAVTRNSPLQSGRPYHDVYSGSADDTGTSANTKKYHSLPDISGLAGSYRDPYLSEKNAQWDKSAGFGSSVSRSGYEQSYYSNTGSGAGGSLSFNGLSKGHGDAFPLHMTPDPGSLWSKQPFEQFGVADKTRAVGSGLGNWSNSINREVTSPVDSEAQLLRSFRHCIVKLLKLEGSDWLFRQNDGADEDLIDCVAARERYLYEAETREMNHVDHMGGSTYLYSDGKSGSALRNDDASITNIMVSSVPHCGEGCVWRLDLIISFGVWSIHRILDLSLMESRPELWGKYTYVLNRLQGIIELAFSKPRTPMSPCFCLQIPASHQHRSSPPASNGMLPPASKPGRGKCTTAATLLDLIKDVEIAISCRKGRSGTAAGDVAFPKGKENLASVLKRYKRRLSNKPIGSK